MRDDVDTSRSGEESARDDHPDRQNQHKAGPLLPSGNGSPLIALIAALTAMRLIYAGVIELRTDEAYYWTWSKESVLSFLDHPPMIAWFIRFGTAIFGDTNLGVRFAGILAMLVTQLLLADIVRRVTHDFARDRVCGADAGGRAVLRAA